MRVNLIAARVCGRARQWSFTVALLLASSLPISGVEYEFVSRNGPVSGDERSTQGSPSADGKKFAFVTITTDFSSIDNDSFPDIYFSEGDGATPILVSASPQGIKGNSNSLFPSISAAGDKIAFASDSSNLSEDNNSSRDVFLWSRNKGGLVTLDLLSQGFGEQTTANGQSTKPALSADGTSVAFVSDAPNMGTPALPRPPGNNNPLLVYVRPLTDLTTGQAVLVSPPNATLGEQANGDCGPPDIDATGNRIVYSSVATNLADDRSSVENIFLVDRTLSSIEVISRGPNRIPANGNSTLPYISDDGRYIAFTSNASNLVVGDSNEYGDGFRFDTRTGETIRVTLGLDGKELGSDGVDPAATVSDISRDGRFVAFHTTEAIVGADVDDLLDVYVHDCLLGKTILASVNDREEASNDNSFDGKFGAGSELTFTSAATNLVSGQEVLDLNEAFDVFYVSGLPTFKIPELEPANSVLYVDQTSAINRLDIDGSGADVTPIDVDEKALFAVDDFNVLWVLNPVTPFQGVPLSRYSARDLTPLPAKGAPTIILPPTNADYVDLCAAGGFAWTIDENGFVRRAAGNEVDIEVDSALGATPEKLSLAIDRFDHLWVGGDYGNVFRLSKFTRDLDLLSVLEYAQTATTRMEQIVADTNGQVLVRSPRTITKIATSGGVLWRQNIAGDGLAVDAFGNVYTVTAKDVVGLDPNGDPFLSIPHDWNVNGSSHVVIDGLGRPWALPQGLDQALRIDRNGMTRLSRFGVEPLADQRHSKATGFTAALAQPNSDSDSDRFLNGTELTSQFNPFDAATPSPNDAVLPVVDFNAKVVGVNDVELSWTSQLIHDFVYVFRDGRLIEGAPFPFDDAATGVTDVGVPGGGVFEYTVIMQGPARLGLPLIAGDIPGAGGGTGNESIPEPSSPPETDLIALGEGLQGTCVPINQPNAVAYNQATNELLTATASGQLLTFPLDQTENQTSDQISSTLLGTAEIRGVEFAPEDPSILFLLLSDGRMLEKNGAVVTVAGQYPASPSEAGFTGLAITSSGGGNDTFVSLGGPDAECLINIDRGTFQPSGSAVELSDAFDFEEGQLLHTRGVTTIPAEASLAVGIGTEGTTTIEHAAKLSSEFTSENSAVPVNSFGSTDLADFTYIPGADLIALADRAGNAVCFVAASFPQSPQITDMTPLSGPWDRLPSGATERLVDIVGVNFGNDPAALLAKMDNTAVVITTVTDTSMTIELPEINTVQEVQIELASLDGASINQPIYTFGFQRSDSNNDLTVDISDAIFTLGNLFGGAANPLTCHDSADANDDGALDISDPVSTINYLFISGPLPPPPFSETNSSWGVDPTGDAFPSETCVN